eukprot:gnl/TRDRNA2_/TRDRNA2_159678_c1_seq1.p1 gnl/TRDRNA2_/TRDRNA2_159678_c1~~gnl/TRDRNA2_/TRDRNA2_159678_c1_seq1.p1  ORF type:complete len:293 (+),score=50.66 gnl/TRDRNA2_/TRDRNA2_159678_c1_seq1:91-879(+)
MRSAASERSDPPGVELGRVSVAGSQRSSTSTRHGGSFAGGLTFCTAADREESEEAEEEVPGKKSAKRDVERLLGDGLRICILGGTKFNGADSEEIVQEVARELSSALSSSVIFLTGGMPGVQETFVRHCRAGSKIYNLLPVGQSSNYGVGEDIPAGANLEERIEIYGQLGHLYITFEGGPGVSKEANAAYARGVGVLPLIRTGGASGGMFDFPAGALERSPFATEEQWELLKSTTASVADTAQAAVEIAKASIAAAAAQMSH